MSAKKEIKPGHYRHYKGGEYQVIATAQHSETGEPLVVYRCWYDGGSWWVRPLSMFQETVMTESGPQPRFRFLEGQPLDDRINDD